MPNVKWTPEGVLPPRDDSDPTSPRRSPYKLSLPDFVQAFACGTERQAILDGYLRHREAVHATGLTIGFQWVDGSFLEDVERIEGRSPGDIDVVTFYYADPATSAAAFAHSPGLFPGPGEEHVHEANKKAFRVDAYFEALGTSPIRLTQSCTYWYSLLSHRRNKLWKGFVQIDLSRADDAKARDVLNKASSIAGATP